MLMPYTTSQVALASKIYRSLQVLKDRKGDYSSKEYLNAARSAGYALFANALFNVVAGGTLGAIAMAIGDDADDKDKEAAEIAMHDLFWNTVQSNLQGLGIPGKLGDWTLNELRGREAFNNIPVIKKLTQGVDIASQYLQVLAQANALYATGQITAEEFFETLFYEVDKDLHDDALAFLGFKNIMDMQESWTQWADADDDSPMTWWDAFMKRKMKTDDEGNIIDGGIIYEYDAKGNTIYEIEKFVKGLWDEDVDKDSPVGWFANVLEKDFKSANGFAGPSFKGPFESKPLTEDPFESKRSNINEMLERIKMRQSLEEEKEEYIKSMSEESEAQRIYEEQKKQEEATEEATMDFWRDQYKKIFNKDPEGMSDKEVIDALAEVGEF
jgi:hypothetical protein